MPPTRAETNEIVRDGLTQMSELVHAVGHSWEQDAFYRVQEAALAAINGTCLYCEVEPGESDVCRVDSAPHPWAQTPAADTADTPTPKGTP